ncbi:TolC family protein [Pelagicoccus enzymogenes]|uniref:TolC family protein n=1 Tax=Pelagicoccus enzymogenes TaxID=2773457 RepID=UPI00280E67EB|nr:TolC family protein [Pelagicoccus enzymogenes]MDQ8201014.1 TolC family protein [Pelagicoccus enzymogenes]
MRPILLLVACCFSSSSFAADPMRGRLPEHMIPQLKEVIASALEGSESMLLREYFEEESEGRRISARAAVMPTFQSNVAFRQEKNLDTAAGEGWENRVVYNVTLSQPLYHWGTRRSEKELGELQYEAEKLNTDLVAASVVSRARMDFMRLIVAKQRAKRARLDADLASGQLDFQRSQVEAGAASESSLTRFELDLERKDLQALRAEADYDYRLDELAIFAAMSAKTLDGLAVGLVPQFEILDEAAVAGLVKYYDQAVEQDERIKQSAINIEVNKRQLEIAQKTLLPKVDAQLGLSSNALDLDGTRREQEYSYFGLSVGWTVFDGYRKKGRTMEALSRLSRAERAKRLGEEQLVLGFDRLLQKLNIEGRALAIEERVLQRSLEELEQVKLAVEEQRAPLSSEEKAQRDYDNTLIRTQDSRISYLDTLSQVASELGLD